MIPSQIQSRLYPSFEAIKNPFVHGGNSDFKKGNVPEINVLVSPISQPNCTHSYLIFASGIPLRVTLSLTITSFSPSP